MRDLFFNNSTLVMQNIVCIGAHCDDIEIGCGGTLLRLLDSSPDIDVTWIIFCADDIRGRESRAAAERLLKNARISKLHLLEFDDSYLPYNGAEAKRALHHIARTLSPDVVFTHFRDDAHQDHRLISELTRNAFRNDLILEYEIPKYDGDLNAPNVFVPLDDAIAEQKLAIVLESFPSQATKHWFSDSTFRSLLRLRGIESGRNNNYAEAFYCRKLVLAP